MSNRARIFLVAASAVGASGVLAASAHGAVPFVPFGLVNEPALSGVSTITPESAALSGAVDTGGNPGSTFTLAAGQTLTWDNSFTLTGGANGLPVSYEHVDGLPIDGSDATYATTSPSTVLNNNGANSYSRVLFLVDPASDYTSNNDSLGSCTLASEPVKVPTAPGLSAVHAVIGAYPAGSAGTDPEPLKPDTKYVYLIEQQAGATDTGTLVNTYAPGASTPVNPTYTCYPQSYVSVVAPYDTYSASGSLSGGVTPTGTPQTAPQPENQGPCTYFYGGSYFFDDSSIGTFKTPPLGSVKVAGAAVQLKPAAAAVAVTDDSVEPSEGSLQLVYAGKTVGSAKFSVDAHDTKGLPLRLTSFGKKLVASNKKFTSKLVYTSRTDQPTRTRHVTL